MVISRFLREDAGALAPVFAVSLVPILALAGAAIDLGNLARAKTELQVAVDSTALAINHNLHLATQTSLESKAEAFFDPLVTQLESPAVDSVQFDVAGGWVKVAGSAIYTPKVMTMLGFGPLTLNADSRTVVGDQEIEVALVLDNSGSMSWNNKIDTLESAAESLVATLYSNESAHTRIKVGIVPFSGAVNVGPDNASADWMDKNAVSPIHSENFSSPANRFTLFTQMTNTSWAGCVETRPGDYATDDTPPDQDDGATLFVPMFAPDEPDLSAYTNNYLTDNGGTCTQADLQDNSEAGKQGRTCKYAGKTPKNKVVVDSEEKQGPNFWCTSRPIVPLTNTVATLNTALDAMVAEGHTNIYEGLMWGWRLLSPAAPFEQGKPYDTPNLRKYIVLMTDGVNTAKGRGTKTINKSEYSPFGYSVKGRLGTTSGTTSTIEAKMDEKLEVACANAKATGIAIYTIAFQLPDENTKLMLEECATQPSMAFEPESNAELTPVFQTIARELGRLRISE